MRLRRSHPPAARRDAQGAQRSRAVLPRDQAQSVRQVSIGMAWMVLAGGLFVAMSAVMKHLGATLPTSEIVLFRMAVGLMIIVPFAWVALGRSGLITDFPGRHAVRTMFGATSLACMVYSVSNLPFAVATALAFTTPLWIVVLALLFLRERPSLRAIVAAIFGFAGVLIIAQPTVVVEFAVIVALFGALCGGAALTMVRSLSRYDRSLTIVVWFSLYGSIFSAPFAIVEWVVPTPEEFVLLSTTGILGASGLFCSAQAYRSARAAFVAPADFVRLPLAALIGLFFFSEIPTIETLIGTLIIVISVISILRDRKLLSRKA